MITSMSMSEICVQCLIWSAFLAELVYFIRNSECFLFSFPQSIKKNYRSGKYQAIIVKRTFNGGVLFCNDHDLVLFLSSRVAFVVIKPYYVFSIE